MYTPFLKYDRFSILVLAFLRGNSFLYMVYDLYEFSLYIWITMKWQGVQMFWNHIFAKWIITNSENFELIDGHVIQS